MNNLDFESFGSDKKYLISKVDNNSISDNFVNINFWDDIESIKDQLEHVWDVSLDSEKGTVLNIL